MLADRYRIGSLIGEGGMAIVYEGEHVAIGKRVAIKLVQSLFANDDEIVQRFEREARSASAVESEHIVHVFDVGNDPDLGLFMVMELLKGEDLGHVLIRRGALDPLFACGLIKQAALGLEKAHAAGVIHRDLKPANVFLMERDDGTTLVKLVDFGIAKIVRDAHDARFAKKGITRRGTAIGTPQYMSPEQAQGLESVDGRSDVFSLGAVLFEAIAGRPHLPERPTYEQTILQLVSTPAPRLRELVPDAPEALDELLADMLERDVNKRVQDMHTLRDRIDAVYPELRGTSVKLRSLPPPPPSPSGASLERYVVHTSGSPTNTALPATAAAIEATGIVALRRRQRSLLAVGALAVVVGGVFAVTAYQKREPVPGVATTFRSEPTHAPSPRIPPPPSVAESVPPLASSVAAGAASSTAPRPVKAPGGAPTRTSPQGGQVGAAGISSQF